MDGKLEIHFEAYVEKKIFHKSNLSILSEAFMHELHITSRREDMNTCLDFKSEIYFQVHLLR